MPPGPKGSLTKKKVQESIFRKGDYLAARGKLPKRQKNNSDLQDEINSFLLRQRKKIVHKLFGKEHQVVFDALFFGLQTLKLRLFVGDSAAFERLMEHLKSSLIKYVHNIREYINAQSENDGSESLSNRSRLARISENLGTNGSRRRKELVRLIREENKETVSELHDNILQTLVSVLMGLQICEKVYKKKQKQAIREINEIELLVWELRQEVTKFCVKEPPSASSTMRLVPALREYVRSLRNIIDNDIRLTCLGRENQLSFPTKVNLFYIAREATANVVRHANASKIELRIDMKLGKVLLEIVDDGIGFDVKETLSKAKRLGHHGLLGIRERVELLGGELTVQSHDGEGTKVSVLMPTDV